MLRAPEGQITFLFTDIEGSTKLSQQFPDKLPAALEKHHSILMEAIESNNGFIFQNVGDAFCCAFASSEDAVKAAVEIQINLANEKWDEAVINVRIGIHSGNAEWNGKNYMGYITLARAARVMSAAYGGQILISNDAYEFCKNNCERAREMDISFRDLGVRRLKDVIEPIRLYQVLSRDLREDFPPLMTLDARPNNLPIQLTSFIGREKEMKHVKETLKLSRLVTLTSAGGSGKTRLVLQTAAEVIDEYEYGVWFVDLAALNDPALLTATIIVALGIKEQSKKTTEETLIDFLKEKQILILLDNCEQLVHACADLTERLLSSCSKLKIIATSREALNCKGEITYRIPPLTIPDPNSNNTPEQLAQYESVRLFIERALVVDPKFRVNNENARALAEICSRLDGIPLAIELAAARTKVLSVEKIYERLDDRFRFLTGGKRTALPRQQTLRALIDWSYDLLSEEEKILWSRLSVFSGGWKLEAAEDICSDETISKSLILDLLSQLTEKSVIIYDESKERYRILESIKQYGIEKLSEGYGVFLRHLNYFLGLSERAAPELRSENARFWLDTIDADHSNFISAIDWSVSNEIADKGAIIAAALGDFWNTAGHYSTGIRLNENILQSSGTLDDSSKIKVLIWLCVFKYHQGDYEQVRKYSEECLAICKTIGDKKGIAESLHNLGKVSDMKGDSEQARIYFEESLAIRKEIGDKNGISDSVQSLGNLSADQGDYEQAKKYFEESFAIKKEIGDKRGMASNMNNLGCLSTFQGDYEQAKIYHEKSLAYNNDIGSKIGIAISTGNLGLIAFNQGDYEHAKKYYEESLAIRKELGNRKGMADYMHNLGGIVYTQGDYEQAKKYFEESLAVRKEIGDKIGMADSMNNLGGVMYIQGDHEQAKKYFEESLAIRREIGDKSGMADSMNNLGSVACHSGDHEQAKKYHEESLALKNEIGDKPGIANTLIYLARLFELNKEYFNAVKLLYAAEHTVKSMGIVFDVNAEKEKNELTARLNELLSAEDFSNYREEGEKMTLEEACKLAISC
jgi:predicted ATPase/class 3 adenylate cyclase/Tfp pilus assembly protein PilF